MKLIIDIDKEYYVALKRLEQKIKDRAEDGFIDQLEMAILNGTQLEDELKSIKEDMKDTFYNYKNNRYDVSMEGILDFLDKRIEENNNEINN